MSIKSFLFFLWFCVCAGISFAALTGGSIIDEAEVQSIDGMPFNNSAFDPYLIAVDGTTVYFASVNITGTYPASQVFSFDMDDDQTTTSATEVFNDSALKTLYTASNSFWFFSGGDIAGGNLFAVTAEDSDGDDGEYIETGDTDRVIRVNIATGVPANVATDADGCVGLTEYAGNLYLLMKSSYGAAENGIATISAAATDGSISYLFTTAQVTAVTGGTTPDLVCIDSTPLGTLVLADNETDQILTVTGLGVSPVLSVLVDATTLESTALGEVTVAGLGVLSTGYFVVSDIDETVVGARGIIGFDALGSLVGVMADEATIVGYTGGDDHLAFTPNNEIQITSDDRVVICNTDNAETIYFLSDPDYVPVELQSYSVE